MVKKNIAYIKKIKMKNLISISIFLIYFFFSFIIFWSFYGTYMRAMKDKHVDSALSTARTLQKFIKEEKEKIQQDARIISKDKFVIASLKNNIIIGENWQVGNGVVCARYKNNNKNKYSDIANEFYKKFYGEKTSFPKKKIEIFDVKGVLISSSEDINSKEAIRDIINRIMIKNEEQVTFVQKFENEISFRALSKIKDDQGIYGFVLVSLQIENIFLENIGRKLGGDVFISDYRTIIFTTIKESGRAIKGKDINYYDFNQEMGYNETYITGKKYGMSFFPLKDYFGRTILFAGTAVSFEEYQKKKGEMISKFVIFQIIFLISIILLTACVIRKLFVPFSNVIRNIKLMKEGKYDKTVQIKGSGELDEIEKDFNDMIKAVEERENALIRLNLNLEEKVKSRTLELLDKNKTLEKLLKEVEDINAKMNSEMAVAKKIHEQLVKFDEKEIFSHNLYMKNISVGGIGGDFVEVVGLKNGNQGIVFADVAGHGVAAALMVSALKFIVNVYLEDIESPAQAMYLINDLINKSFVPGITVSLVYMIIDKNSETITLSTAFQEDIYLVKEKIVKKLVKSGIILGVLENEEIVNEPALAYKDKKIKLEKGEKIFLYTDGLVENYIFNRETIEWELEKLKKISGKEFGEELEQQLLKSKEEKKDDITYLVLEKSC